MKVLASSFRDPSGFLFLEDNCLYRQINASYLADFNVLLDSGLYQQLTENGLLVGHLDVSEEFDLNARGAATIIKPDYVPYISYPYEWSFSQLKNAALLTLNIQKQALARGMILKDASAYNIQFVSGSPVFIDTLSFQSYQEGSPWVAYKQFCQHFLAPLALMSKVDIRLAKLLVNYIDGLPLDLTSRLLPRSTYLNYSLLAHIHLHALAQRNYADSAAAQEKISKTAMSRERLLALVSSLESAVNKLEWKIPRTEWGNYYENTNYEAAASLSKSRILATYLEQIPGELAVIQDLGANRGEYSRIAASHAGLVVAQDIDPVAVELNYRMTREDGIGNILPLHIDLFAPSPAIGWANAERDSFSQRNTADVVMALALIHHLSISNNVPLESIARFLSTLCRWLIIEFVPKSDSQVKRLLATREDVFPDYNEPQFEQTFGGFFALREKQTIDDSERTLYLYETK